MQMPSELPPNLIVCAALRGDIGGEIVLGVRHHDEHMREELNTERCRFTGDRWEQGFVDKYGNFQTREEAWLIAEAAGQIRRRVGGDHAFGAGKLYSENLY